MRPCTSMHYAQCRSHGVLPSEFAFALHQLGKSIRSLLQVIVLCTGSSLDLHSKRVATYNGLYRKLLAAVKYATTTMYKCRQRCSVVTVMSCSISAVTSRHTTSRSSVLRWRINTGWQQEHQDWWPACYWMLMTCCCGCVLSPPSCSEVIWSCTTCIVTLTPHHLSLKTACRSTILQHDLW